MPRDAQRPGLFNGGPLDGQAAQFVGWAVAVPVVECGTVVSHVYEWREFIGIRDNRPGSDGLYAYRGREFDPSPNDPQPRR